MTNIQFAYKEIIATHHLDVPIRPLQPNFKKSIKPNRENPLDDNLIIRGDNLEALKALLPKYGGRVNCIYIDPPYNIGKAGWIYNDNVSHPAFKNWLKKTVDAEDMEKHDKWCCMMWPRLNLLRELLAENGVIFVSIDDTEQHRLRMMMDEIFGKDNFVTNIVWQKKFSPQNDASHFSDNHDFIVVYAKDKNIWRPILFPRTEKQDKAYINPDNDPRGNWSSSGLDVKTYQKDYDYPITTPSGRVVNPPRGRCWRHSKEKFQEMIADNRIWFGESGNNVPRVKRFLSDVKGGITPLTVWLYKDYDDKKDTILPDNEVKHLHIPRWLYTPVGHTQGATQALKQIGIDFSNPKPHTLIERILQVGSYTDSIILDSFAGSGTTAHAVLDLNKQDGGNRKFILVQLDEKIDPEDNKESYDFCIKNKLEPVIPNITLERVRRVIKGVPDSKNYKEPLGGSFTYCTMGKPIDIDKMLTGKELPEYSALASHLLYKSYLISTEKTLKEKQNGKFYSDGSRDYYLLYKPDIKYLQSKESSLTEEKSKAIFKRKKPAVVFASDKELSQRELSRLNIEFCRIPDAVMERGTGADS